MSLIGKNDNLPNRSNVLAWDEFVELTGVSPDHLREIIALGWIDSRTGASETYMFHDDDIYKVRKLERICGDFELPVIGGTIIVDLLERIDLLEQMIQQARKLNRL